eukprot:Lithocolla_globosa_v1_NODE_6006_length_1151_cov_7.972628.p2 type:complete len:316 gc:universal NODE_6006_length_1151_cov_7.972628:100-1047(+)
MESLLECPVCFDLYRDPVVLPCSHTFCLSCVKELDPSRCPLDRKPFAKTSVDTLPKNYVASAVIEELEQQPTPSKPVSCCECEEQAATLWCEECGALCSSCSGHFHAKGRRRSHQVVPLGKKKRVEGLVACVRHPHAKEDIYCETCQVLVCHLCERIGHQDHPCSVYSVAAEAKRKQAAQLVEPFHSQQRKLETEHAALVAGTVEKKSRALDLAARLQALEQEIAAEETSAQQLQLHIEKVELECKSITRMLADRTHVDFLNQTALNNFNPYLERSFQSLFGTSLQTTARPSFQEKRGDFVRVFGTNGSGEGQFT